ncbi:MAG: serine/threonine protein kinase [Myxococcales bacterium]|nr:serine/threonine protein kinase [Myxococcales bacterium]
MSKNVPNTAETPLPAAIPAAGELGPLVGRTFGGYEVTSYIGEGPTGAVYRAEDLVGAKMAVKVMHRELSQKAEAEQLWSELKRLAATGDEHFVRVYDCGFGDAGEFYFTQDELLGVDLEAALEESGAFAPRRAIEIVDGIAAALERAHGQQIIHGGLKPRNVFLSPAGGTLQVKVLDFGASRLAGGVDKGVIVGNPFYMAPEQFGGAADERTDVYSLGVLMYELFSGTLPFNGPTHGQVMMRHLAEPPQPPPGVDALLGRVILKALSKAPADRYSSVASLRATVKKWANDAGTLHDAAASQVIARAAEARKIKHAALTTPDATVPMNKIDAAELVEATRQQLEPSNKRNGNGQGKDAMNTTTRKEENPNSSESVEASLEDFISQANASFPTSDGWDLHTGDVELVDDADEGRLEEMEHVSAPIVVKPATRKAETAAHLIKKADQSARVRKISAAMLDDPNAATVVTQYPKRRAANPFEAPVVIEEAEPAPLDPPPTGPRRRSERTEVISSPRSSVPWTANPLVWVAGVFAAFVMGAVLVFVMVRTMMPTQPVVVQTPAPVVIPAPAAAAPAAATAAGGPVVTPLGASQAGRPVVTPLDAPKAGAAEPAAAQAEPAVAAKADRPAHHAAKHAAKAATTKEPAAVAKAPAEKPARAEAPARAASKKSTAASASDDDDDDSAPAAPAKHKAAAATAKKEGKPAKGGDWVDPFAQ